MRSGHNMVDANTATSSSEDGVFPKTMANPPVTPAQRKGKAKAQTTPPEPTESLMQRVEEEIEALKKQNAQLSPQIQKPPKPQTWPHKSLPHMAGSQKTPPRRARTHISTPRKNNFQETDPNLILSDEDDATYKPGKSREGYEDHDEP